jgi:hypothetical protein
VNTIYRQFDDSTVGDSDQYFKHVDAMTREDLHSKAEIALELASRDLEIESLRTQLKTAKADGVREFGKWYVDTNVRSVFDVGINDLVDLYADSLSKGKDCESSNPAYRGDE